MGSHPPAFRYRKGRSRSRWRCMEPRWCEPRSLTVSCIHCQSVQSIAVVSNPAFVSIHSIQDGKLLCQVPIAREKTRVNVAGVWWFREEKKSTGNGLPDIFKRGDNIVRLMLPLFCVLDELILTSQTGSAHTILKGLPLLDPMQDDMKPLT